MVGAFLPSCWCRPCIAARWALSARWCWLLVSYRDAGAGRQRKGIRGNPVCSGSVWLAVGMTWWGSLHRAAGWHAAWSLEQKQRMQTAWSRSSTCRLPCAEQNYGVQPARNRIMACSLHRAEGWHASLREAEGAHAACVEKKDSMQPVRSRRLHKAEGWHAACVEQKAA
eukprot:1159789-Pelagomonas_calceolata.AAC.7